MKKGKQKQRLSNAVAEIRERIRHIMSLKEYILLQFNVKREALNPTKTNRASVSHVWLSIAIGISLAIFMGTDIAALSVYWLNCLCYMR